MADVARPPYNARAFVDAAAATRMLHTLPMETALRDATALLTDLAAACAKHDVDPAAFDLQADMACASLFVFRRRYRSTFPQNTPGPLLDKLAERLRQLHDTLSGRRTIRHWLFVELARTEKTPKWGATGNDSLSVTISPDTGWTLALGNQLYTGSPAIALYGPVDEHSVDDVAHLAHAVNTGEYGNLFATGEQR